MINFIYTAFLDILFPKKGLEREIDTLLPEHLFEKVHIQEHGGAVSLCTYKDPLIKQMVWLLKYKKSSHVAKLFASILYDCLIEDLSDDIIFSEGIERRRAISFFK